MIDFTGILTAAHEQGLSDTKLSREAGVDPASIWRWRKGFRSPTLNSINTVLAAIERLGFGDTYTAIPVVTGAAGGGRQSSSRSFAARPCSGDDQ